MSTPHPNTDVRMRGFTQRSAYDEAQLWLQRKIDQLNPIGSEKIPVFEAASRVLAKDVISRVHVPSFSRAMMDGYALRSTDIELASDARPIQLKVIGECFPGKKFERTVAPGQAVRIMTGAPLPLDVDAVLPVEKTQTNEGSIIVQLPLAAGKNFGQIGEDIQQGDIVLRRGRTLRPQDIGLLCSIGHSVVEVVGRPRVNLVITGSELLPAGQQPAGCQIVDSNGPMLSELVQRDGGLPLHLGILPDNREAIREALSQDADILIASGGSSVGQEDHVPILVAEQGELAIHGVAMRPAAPLGLGTLAGRLVFLLPGNPVASLCGYDLFAGRAVRSLGGHAPDLPYRKTTMKLAKEIQSPVGRTDYVRVEIVAGTLQPLVGCGASVLSSSCRAAGFVMVPGPSSGYPAGTDVEVFLYD